MRPTYRSTETFIFDADSVTPQAFVLLPDRHAADVFMERVYPLLNTCIVGSADRAFPEHPGLNQMFFERLENDPELAVVLFSAEIVHQVKIRSERLLFIDQIIATSHSAWNAHAALRLDLDERKLVGIMKSFFNQWKAARRSGNYSYHYRHSKNLDQRRMGWLLDLIAARE